MSFGGLSMTLDEAKNIIQTEFLTKWNNQTPVEVENVSYKPVNGTAWVRFSVVESRTTEPELGRHGSHTRKRHFGQVFIEVFRPAYRGDALKQLVNDAENSLEFRTLAGEITLDASYRSTIGQITGGSWYVDIVTVPYWFDEIKTSN
jgi:hypothetical protein